MEEEHNDGDAEDCWPRATTSAVEEEVAEERIDNLSRRVEIS